MTKMRKFKPVTLIALVVSVALLGTTFAYLQQIFPTKQNNFAGDNGRVNIGVVEYDSSGKRIFETGEGLELTPNDDGTYSKYVDILNYDQASYKTTDTLVRARIVLSYVYNEDNAEYKGQVYPQTVSGFTLSGTTDDWYQKTETNGETYYYFKDILAPDDETTRLLEKVTTTEAIPEGTHLQVQILADGVNVTGGDKYTNAKAAWNLSDYDIKTIYGVQ